MENSNVQMDPVEKLALRVAYYSKMPQRVLIRK